MEIFNDYILYIWQRAPYFSYSYKLLLEDSLAFLKQVSVEEAIWI